MTRTAIFLAAFLAATPAAAYDIHYDMGGNVMAYVARYRAADKPIRILGPCGSACTIAAHYPDTCVGPGAKLIFHATTRPWMTRALRKYYPRNLRQWLDFHGGLLERPLTLRGRELTNIIKRCKS